MPTPKSLCPRCIITGCTLVVQNGPLDLFWQSGDLFELNDCYIFNAVGEPNYGTDPFYSMSIAVNSSDYQNHFERRNVFVFAKESAALNDEATAYITRAAA